MMDRVLIYIMIFILGIAGAVNYYEKNKREYELKKLELTCQKISQDNNFYGSLKTNRDCFGVALVVNGKSQTAYQCKHRLYFQLDGKTVEVNQEQ